jgi:hypothetical protein
MVLGSYQKLLLSVAAAGTGSAAKANALGHFPPKISYIESLAGG